MKFTKIICICTATALMLTVIGLVSKPMNLSTSAETASSEIVQINGIDYRQTFEDEFEGTSLNKTKWNYCPEWGRQGNYCYWENDMTSLDGDGHLLLNAAYDKNGILRCGAIRTRDLFYQKYGYFEINVKLQSKGGFWSAFWMMPDNIDTGIDGGSDGTEIDIYEAFSVQNESINHAVHYDGYGSRHKSKGRSVYADVYDGNYHTFALDWSPDGYKFYIDGKNTYTLTSEDVDVSTVKSYMKISLESGSWTGLPKESDLPDGISVDYVKVYQRDEYLNQTTTTTTIKPTTQPTTEAVLPGDANSDKNVNALDLLTIRKYIVNSISTMNFKAADVNGDGKYNAIDLLMIQKHIVGFKLSPWD